MGLRESLQRLLGRFAGRSASSRYADWYTDAAPIFTRNILIRAVRPKKLNRQKMKKAEEQYTALCRDFHVSPTIDQL